MKAVCTGMDDILGYAIDASVGGRGEGGTSVAVGRVGMFDIYDIANQAVVLVNSNFIFGFFWETGCDEFDLSWNRYDEQYATATLCTGQSSEKIVE